MRDDGVQRLQAGRQVGRRRARHPGDRRRATAALVLRQAEGLGEERGRAGPGYIIFEDEGEPSFSVKGPIAKFLQHRSASPTMVAKRVGLKAGGRAILRLRQAGEGRQLAGARASASATSSAREDGRVRVLLDRRLPDVRMERGREEDRLLAQSVLDAARRSRGPRHAKDPLDIKAFQYDIVCNGIELSSGAIRNHRPEIMRKAFEIAGYGAEVLEERFGGMYRAFQCGAPPHGGIAPASTAS